MVSFLSLRVLEPWMEAHIPRKRKGDRSLLILPLNRVEKPGEEATTDKILGNLRELKHQTFLIHEWHGWPFRTGSGTRFACQMQIIKQNNVKPSSRTPTDNSVENLFQWFALSFVSFLRRKHDFRRGISTFVWRILFEEPRIWTSGFNLRTRVLKSVTAAQECLDMRRGCHAAKILPVGVCGTKNVPGT